MKTTPERLEEIRVLADQVYAGEIPQTQAEALAVIIRELADDLQATCEGMAAQLQTFCPPEEAAVLRGAAKSAADVVEAAREVELYCPPGDGEQNLRLRRLREALERHDEAAK